MELQSKFKAIFSLFKMDWIEKIHGKQTCKPEKVKICFPATKTAYFENFHWLLFVNG